ncbi:hypothetical protein D8I24_5674 [Cupriavidus necator H850]|uniref:hypothetical protein n=1 Tax=Cupriavidus necator TaxID=106590 RepID=UPI00129EFD55|nr:hypothetical protein [Cupriavidus necator]KAI3598728.1 hypothetical protein D8I24_5674 [Cupriavidus necator H850]
MTTRTLSELGAAMYGGAALPLSQPQPGTRTSADLGEAMYGANGSMRQQPQPPAAPAPEPDTAPPRQRTAEELAAAAYPDKPEPLTFDAPNEEVQAIRDDLGRRMYSAQETFRKAIPDATEAAPGVDLANTNRAVAEIREIAADLNLAPADISTIRSRAAQIHANAPSKESQVDASIEALNARFGNDAAQALRDARLLLQRDPRAARMIERAGLGDDPATVVMIAERARSQIAAGKLKRK